MNKEVIIDIENPKDNDLISRQAVLGYLKSNVDDFPDYHEAIEKVLQMPPVTQKSGKSNLELICEELAAENDKLIEQLKQKSGKCKDCKWWKDSDGFYRRGGRDDKCPINRREVYEGKGYCYLFESQERNDKE